MYSPETTLTSIFSIHQLEPWGGEYVVNGAVYSQNKGNGWELSGIATDGGAVYTVCVLWGERERERE